MEKKRVTKKTRWFKFIVATRCIPGTNIFFQLVEHLDSLLRTLLKLFHNIMTLDPSNRNKWLFLSRSIEKSERNSETSTRL